MKLATYQDGSRDGQLVVVARDLSSAHYATGIAQRLQQALDDWNFIAPQLQELSDSLNRGKARHAFAFDPARCMAPLPRAYQWIVGAAYPSRPALQALHTALDGSGADAPAAPLRQAASDDLLGPCDPLPVLPEAWQPDLGAGLAAITGEVPQAATPGQALDTVRLLLLVNTLALNAAPQPLDALAASAFGPVAVTPDELGDAWAQGRLHLTLQVSCNGRKLGMCDAGAAMQQDFGQLIAQAASVRRLRPGSIIGSGTVGNPGQPRGEGKNRRTEWPKGCASLADKRAIEQAQGGAPQTPWLRPGDSLRIDLKGKDGQSVFGPIAQSVGAPQPASAPAEEAPPPAG